MNPVLMSLIGQYTGQRSGLFLCFALATIALSVILSFAQTRIRVGRVQRFARERGFSYMQELSPTNLQWNSQTLRSATAIRNAIFGERNERTFAFFDCEFKGRKKSDIRQFSPYTIAEKAL